MFDPSLTATSQTLGYMATNSEGHKLGSKSGAKRPPRDLCVSNNCNTVAV